MNRISLVIFMLKMEILMNKEVLADGDEKGYRVRFGEVSGKISPAAG